MSVTKLDLLTRMLVFVWLVLSVGCANVIENRDLPDDERVRIRAQGWADALLDDDLKGAYAYTSPAYRTASTYGAYHARVAARGNWVSMQVGSVKCVEDVCDVRYVLEYRLSPSNQLNTRSIDHRWVKSDGQWWLYVP